MTHAAEKNSLSKSFDVGSPRLNDFRWAARQAARKLYWNMLPLRAHVAIAQIMGKLYRRAKGVPAHVRRNVDMVFDALPESERLQIARDYVEFSRHMYLERILPALPSFAEKGFQVIGRENLEVALDSGRGVIVATGHFGHGRLVGTILSILGYDIKRVVAASTEQVDRRLRIRSWLEERRESFGVRQLSRLLRDSLREQDIPATLDIRPILAALRSNNLVMIAGDGLIGSDFVRLSLLGRDYPFPKGFMKIAMLSESPIVPAFAYEDIKGKIILEFFPALQIDFSASVEENLGGFVSALENMIQRHPGQWTRWGVVDPFESAISWTETDLTERADRSFTTWATVRRDRG